MNDIEEQADLEAEAQRLAEALGNAQRVQDLAPQPRQRIGSIDGQDIFSGDSPGLNAQGHGAVGVALSPGPLARQYRQVAYDPGVPNPLTGILEPTPQVPGQQNPWIADQVQRLEQSMDIIRQNAQGKWTPDAQAYALQKKEMQLRRLDPQGQYRRGSPQSQMTQAQKWAAQNIFKDPNTGMIFYHDGRTWKHIEPKDTADYHQKLLDIREQHHKELMAHREAQLEELKTRHQMALEELKAHHKAQMEAITHGQDLRHSEAEKKQAAVAAKRDEHLQFFKHYDDVVAGIRQRLTKTTGAGDKKVETQPTPEEIAAEMDRFYPHLRKRRWEIQDEEDAMRGGDETGGAMGQAHAGFGSPSTPPPPPKPNQPAIPSVDAARDMIRDEV